jgi:hypothetical protein
MLFFFFGNILTSRNMKTDSGECNDYFFMQRHVDYFSTKKFAAACSPDMCYLCKNLHNPTSHNKSTWKQYAP